MSITEKDVEEDTSPKDTVQRTMKVTLHKPMNTSWENAGKILRSVQKACVNVANSTITNCLAIDYQLFDSIEFTPSGMSIPKDGNKKIKLPDFKEPKEDDSFYNKARSRCPFVASTIVASVSREVQNRYRKSRFAILVSQEKSRTYRNYSIPINPQSCSITKNTTEKYPQYIISMALLSKDADGFEGVKRVEFQLDLKDSYYEKKIIDQIISGEQKQKEIKITYLDHKKKWILLIPYDKKIEQNDLDLERVLNVYPPGPDKTTGMGRFLALTFFGPSIPWTDYVEYDSIQRTNEVFDRRCKSISNKYRQDQKMAGFQKVAAVGHGRNRAIKNKMSYRAKHERILKTFCQQRAAFIVNTAIKMKCGTIHMVNMTEPNFPKDLLVFRQFPYYQLQNSIKCACENRGVAFVLDKEFEKTLKSIQGKTCTTQTN